VINQHVGRTGGAAKCLPQRILSSTQQTNWLRMKQETRDLSIGEALDLGTGYAIAGNHASAIEIFRGVLLVEPENFEAIQRLGTSLFETGELYEAFYWFWRGKKINRRQPLALSNYGLCVSQLGHFEEGLPDLQLAIFHAEKAGDSFSRAAKSLTYNNLGNTLERLKRHAEALVAFDKGIAYEPNDPFPHYNRGIALMRLNRHREAIEALSHSLSLDWAVDGSPSRLNPADVRYNRGMASLLLGDMQGGFADYEYRLLTSESAVHNLGLDPALKWQPGDAIEGKTLLVHCEQGLGDTIQFLRFVPLLADLGPKEVRIVAHAPIRPMIDIPGVRVMQPGDALTDQYDCWVALMSLPLHLGIEEATIPAPWQPNIEGATIQVEPEGGFNVGVCWAGNFQHKNDEHRSIPLSQFAALFDAEGCDFTSVQQMRPGETHEFAEIKATHPNLEALLLNDFRDTARVLLTLDLVVTVDTAVAHLAGTLGVPTWLLVPAYSTDWRWQLDRTDSPWYPSVKLYRQPKVGDWKSVLDRVKRDLVSLAAQEREPATEAAA
jgi:tetratricopeptide (TPR) repeat protein